jgi:hypothetical protein
MRTHPICKASPLERGPTTLFYDPGFLCRELEEYLDLEGRYLARQVPPTEKCRVPGP